MAARAASVEAAEPGGSASMMPMGPGEQMVYQSRTNNAGETNAYIQGQQAYDESNMNEV